jgi:type IV pilus assembly protein PilB
MSDIGSQLSDILGRAMARGATTIYVEPGDGAVRVRFRVDGVVEEAMTLSRHLGAHLVSRFKKMAYLDVAEHRLPQEGLMTLAMSPDARVTFHVSILPGVDGEAVVVRRLSPESMILSLDALGIAPGSLDRLRLALRAPGALVLFAGPTGSGRHTSAYASIVELNTPEVCIATVEDPVRLRLEGVHHVAVDYERGLEFPQCLKAVAGIDVDVIMLGDVRDRETARDTVALACSGARIVASIHTNDAPSTLVRLTNMGVDSWALAGTRVFVQAQRLLRRLCDACKRPLGLAKAGGTAGLVALGLPRADAAAATVFEPTGCPSCHGTGYQGRVLATEQLPWTPEIERAVLEDAGSRELAGLAVEAGMRTLRQSALDALLAGTTSPSEVARCTPPRPAYC